MPTPKELWDAAELAVDHLYAAMDAQIDRLENEVMSLKDERDDAQEALRIADATILQLAEKVRDVETRYAQLVETTSVRTDQAKGA